MQLESPRVLIESDDIALNSMPTNSQHNKESDESSAVDERTLRKILEVEQKNTALLREIVRNQMRLEDSIEERFSNISDTIVNLKEQKSVVSDHGNKKDKKKSCYL